MAQTFDVAIVGAGVFGAWTALTLRRRGISVLLLDAYGPANVRASSGGESRIIRLGYGADEIYTRWSANSLPRWKELFAQTGEHLFHRTGVLWLVGDGDTTYESQTLEVLARNDAPHEKLSAADVTNRFPQFASDGVSWGIFEPESGVLMARRAVQAVVYRAIEEGVEYRLEAGLAPETSGRITEIRTGSGASIRAGAFVFACGPWLPKIFPGLLADRFFISRQEVFFFGVPASGAQFSPSQMPTWIFHNDTMYGMPDLESRGVKLACDLHGPAIDPDTAERTPSPEAREKAIAYVNRCFPALRGASIVESRVCQYENTSSGDFLVDRHPEMENIWLVGGGSGHGFKHGPAMGEYVASQILGEQPAEPRFLLAAKQAIQHRCVF